MKERATKSQPVVKQAKILLDEERPGPDGAPRSKGIGFVEFTEHEHALCALRQLNNNPTAFSKVGAGSRSQEPAGGHSHLVLNRLLAHGRLACSRAACLPARLPTHCRSGAPLWSLRLRM